MALFTVKPEVLNDINIKVMKTTLKNGYKETRSVGTKF